MTAAWRKTGKQDLEYVFIHYSLRILYTVIAR